MDQVFPDILEDDQTNSNDPERDRSIEADLRRQSRHRSLVNWGSYRLFGQPVNYTGENRSIKKEEALRDDASRIEEGGITTKSKRRRMNKMLANEQKPHAALGMMAIHKTRSERRSEASDARRKASKK